MWLLVLGMLVAPAAWPAPAGDSTAYTSGEALARYARGRLLEERGEYEQALSEYFRALVSDPRALEPARRASELSARLGDHGRSLEFADRALAIAPGDARSLWLRGAALFNVDRPREALESLEAAVARDPGTPEFWRTLARVAEEQRDIQALVRARRALTEIDDEDAENWFLLAGALARSGKFTAAESAFVVSREAQPDRPGTDFLGAWIDDGLGRDEEAVKGFARHLHSHPEDVITRQRQVALLGGLGRFDEAYREARTVTQARPTDPEALETEADLAFRTRNVPAGHDRLAALLRLDPDDSRLVSRALTVLARNGRAAEAPPMAKRWSDAHPADWRGRMLEAQALAVAGSFDAAIEKARAAGAMVPDSLAPRFMLGRIAQQSKRWKVAAEAWSDLRSRRPEDTGLALDLAFCREQLGEIDEALRVSKAALERRPGDPSVLNFIGYLLADHNRDLPEAEKMLQQAVSQEPDNGAFIDSLGWVYYRLGRLQAAREKLEQAAGLTRGDPTVLEHLGDVYRDLKLLDLARDQYRRSLAADSSNQRVRNKLETLR